jgi:TonB-linked SusC/RagA family outer membrane protein
MRSLILSLLFCTIFTFSVSAQSRVSGKVTDNSSGLPIKGASVVVSGKKVGTTTDENGNFTLDAASDALLEISYLGYGTQRVKPVGGVVNISLTSVTQNLTDVVVVGYGTQKRKSVTGAISRVTADEVRALPVPDARQALQGRVPGLTVINNGSPGEAPIVRIRGIGSINYASEPLYVIDGMPGADMAMIDSRDIESIDVLRDASSAAIYGSRAANGVVMVTTKKGSRTNGFAVNLDSYVGVQSAWKKLDLLNTDEYITYATALKTNAGSAMPSRFSALDEPVYQGTSQTYRQTNTDWQDEMFRDALITQTNISISNTSDKLRLYASGGYMQQDGILIGTSYKRFNFRINTEYNISKRVSFGQMFTFAGEDKLNDQNGGGRTQLKHIIHNIPYIPVKDPTLVGGYRGPDNKDGSDPQNPVRIALQDQSRNKTARFLGTAYLDINIIKGLKYRFLTGLNYGNFVNYINEPIYNESFNARALNRVEQTNNVSQSLLLSNQLTYERDFGKHTVNVLAVAESQTGSSRFIRAGGTYTTNELRGISSSLRDPSVNGGLFEDALISYLGRINYDYDDKYLLSASIRRDGFSGFAPDKKWGNFPSVSVGWRISEENFMLDNKLISELKVRASWGQMGFNGIGSYAWQPVLQQNAGPILGDSRVPTAFINALGNADLGWEITDMMNVGLDLGFMRNRLQFAFEYYVRKTNDLILQAPLANSLGFSNNTPANVGTMENKGFEMMASYFGADDKKLKWNVSANFSTVKNEVLDFGPNIQSPIFAGANADYGGFDITITRPGDAVQSFFGWQTQGIFQSQKEIDEANALDGNASTKYQDNAKPGDIRFRDVNGDGTINADDRVILGTFLPDFSYGANFNATYGNFDLNMFWLGVSGNSVYNGTKVLTQGMLRLFGAGKEVLNAWTPTNTNTDIPRAVDGDPNNNSRSSDRFLESGSYLRLKLLSVGYNFRDIASITGNSVKRLRIYLMAQNLLTFTSYSGYDPEIGSRFNTALTGGVDYGQFPQARTFIFGIQAGF